MTNDSTFDADSKFVFALCVRLSKVSRVYWGWLPVLAAGAPMLANDEISTWQKDSCSVIGRRSRMYSCVMTFSERLRMLTWRMPRLMGQAAKSAGE